jgi:predicted nucleic acid-binding protein
VGLIHVDAGVVIGFLDADDAHHDAARTCLADAIEAGDQIAMAASALAECLVGPARRGEDAIGVVLELTDRLPITVVALDVGIATVAARLRAAHRSLRLPDALVIATAIDGAADLLITTDRKWPTAKALGLAATIKRI